MLPLGGGTGGPHTPDPELPPTATKPKRFHGTVVLDSTRVGRDASKIAEAQATIAAEVKPMHAPRQRPAVLASTEGPLVLVETKRDLRDKSLPFEKSANQESAA